MKINHPRRYLLLAATLVGLATIVHFGDDGVEVYIPRTLVHYKCHFPDGSYAETKERYKWLFYLEVFNAIPRMSANTSKYLDFTEKYVDAKGRTHQHVGIGEYGWDCIGIGKRNGRLFWTHGFENSTGQMVHFDPNFNAKGVIAPRWEDFPKGISHYLPKSLFHPDGDSGPPTENQKFLKKEHLYTGDGTYVLPIGNDNSLLFEQTLTALKHPTVPMGTVLYVYQSLSSDNGKTWSPPVITKDAKLFEIGKLITEQSWSAKPDIIVKHASLRP